MTEVLGGVSRRAPNGKFATVAALSLSRNPGQALTGVAPALHSAANGDAATMSGQGIIDDDWSCCQSFHGAVTLPLDITDGVARNARTWEHSRELRRLRLSELWTAPNLVLIAYHQRRQRCGVRIAGIFSVGGRSVTLSRFQKWWRFWDDLGPPCLRLKYGQGKGRSTLLFRRGLKVDSVGIKDLSLSAVMPHPPLESVRPSVMEFVPRNKR